MAKPSGYGANFHDAPTMLDPKDPLAAEAIREAREFIKRQQNPGAYDRRQMSHELERLRSENKSLRRRLGTMEALNMALNLELKRARWRIERMINHILSTKFVPVVAGLATKHNPLSMLARAVSRKRVS